MTPSSLPDIIRPPYPARAVRRRTAVAHLKIYPAAVVGFLNYRPPD